MYSGNVTNPGTGSPPTSKSTPVVFIVEDDELMRESINSLIRSVGWKAKTFGSALDFLSYPRAVGPNCLVLDINLPESSGLDLQKRVAGERTEMPIIFVTGSGDVPTAVRAMKAGAIEFLIKPFRDDVLLEAIQQAIVSSRATIDAAAEMSDLQGRFVSLNAREREVMTLVITGLLNKQVAGELGLSEITIKTYRGRAMKKMKARSFAELVNMAASLRLMAT
ncbi:response regulator transcription factor [Acidisphaera sp. S103]|uniref:response regulator transcription factor n=1 Tax=Acidisphaera sp. S103 TaxID=1747223 RepID=UPI00131D121A|nr:response regulator [Acidisphaera sp. S103]